MKINKISFIFYALAVFVFTGCKNENPDSHHFGNKLYISTGTLQNEGLLIKDEPVEYARSITARLAMPAGEDVTVTFEARPDWATAYNRIYGDEASALPAECYDLPEKVVTIRKGEISGENIVVNFTTTAALDKDSRYVLPVTVANATNIELLESARTVYFVFKGAALINVVANIAHMHFPIRWQGDVAEQMKSLSAITVEALVRSSDWVAGRGNALSTVFGRENVFLVRIGDADRPRNQLQLVTPDGKWPSANAVKGLPVNEWVHIAIVYDTQTKERIYYMNGKRVAYDLGATEIPAINGGCYIGMSFGEDRWMPGEMAEVRIWNCQRTAGQIAENPYYVDPDSEGLLAYWKFNEGEGSLIHDVSGNGADLTGVASDAESDGTPKWINVELPDPNE